ncbi:putative UPF0481 protein At3g02645 [Arachis stenosperma]|uniref:putative UPF0481 protein At3g02645 n=1 Tax=Arachis stenosperma TaxID=217475 RepID=UPI0025AC7638|nr:putative UPF0481 protein At3g02645 [Arachis stenosperma]XP_057757674.1 putative UPF0481 protein At3g02645 [Arachis stenosperma]
MAANDVPNNGMEDGDLNGWKESASKALLGSFQAHSEPIGISNVPRKLREGNKNAFMPKTISIGPRYKGARRDLMKWQNIKLHSMQSLLHRGPNKPAKIKLQECMEAILKLEKEVRANYADDLKMEWNDLANIMLSDAGFLLELLISSSKEFNEKLKSRLAPPNPDGEVKRTGEVVTDLLVLENQIPLIILHKLSEIILVEDDISIESLALNFFGYIPDERFRPDFNPGVASRHFLELIHSYISEDSEEEEGEQQDQRNEQRCCNPINSIKSVNFQKVLNTCANCASDCGYDVEDAKGIREETTDAASNVQQLTSYAQLNRCAPILAAAGVTIIKTIHSNEEKHENPTQGPNEIRGFNFNIKFQKTNGTLEIPQLHITKSTEVTWRNLIAWEQGHTGFSCKHKCTWAALFFNGLMCCENDVQLLKDKQVIVDHLDLGNRKLLEFFRSIVHGVDSDKASDSPYWEMVSVINSYRGTCCLGIKKYSIILRHSWIPTVFRHFDRLVLRGYNLLIGMISLYALMQTIYTILGYYEHPRVRNSGQMFSPPPRSLPRRPPPLPPPPPPGGVP